MRSNFIEGLRIRENLKRTKNIYSSHKKLDLKMKVRIGAKEISRRVQAMAKQIAMDYREKYRDLQYITSVRKEERIR